MKQNHFNTPNLLAIMANDNDFTWNHIYNKYAAVMYGSIFNLTNNRQLAEKIFIEAFVGLKTDGTLLQVKPSITLFLFWYAEEFAKKYLLHQASISNNDE